MRKNLLEFAQHFFVPIHADSERFVNDNPRDYFDYLKRTDKNLAAAHFVAKESYLGTCHSPNPREPMVSVTIAYYLGTDRENVQNQTFTVRALKK